MRYALLSLHFDISPSKKQLHLRLRAGARLQKFPVSKSAARAARQSDSQEGLIVGQPQFTLNSSGAGASRALGTLRLLMFPYVLPSCRAAMGLRVREFVILRVGESLDSRETLRSSCLARLETSIDLLPFKGDEK